MTEGEARSKMLYALMGMRAMSDTHQRYSSSVTSRVYEKYRIEHALNHSTTMKQKNLVPWNKGGVEISDEHRANLVQAALQRAPKSEESIQKWKESRDGYKHSDETKEKQRLSQIGKVKGPQSEEHRKAIGESIKGKPKKEGHADNVRKANLGNISINKDGAEKKVKSNTLPQWLEQGWQLGGRKRK